MKVKLLKWQQEVQQDQHRFRIICAGRRAGKSVLSRMIVLKWATEKPGLYWIVNPTYRQAEMIHWKELQKEIPYEWIKKKTDRPYLSIELHNGSIIELKGSENPDALRGVKLRGLVVDEIASIRNWDWLWSEVLRATLTDYEAPVIFISTPKGYNHFYNLYEEGQKQGNYKSWRFTSYDNPVISKEEIDAAKKELTEDTFAQEYLADFRKYTGLVYKDFARETHVCEPFTIDESWQRYRGIDFGSTNPTACLWIAVDGDENWFIFDEHYETEKTIDYHAGNINAKSANQHIGATYGDPSGAQWISEFAQRGIYITLANKETGTNFNSWVRYGIEKVAERLKRTPGRIVSGISRQGDNKDNAGEPSLFIFGSCTNTIRELETYRWKEKSVTQAQDLNEPDVPEKANDHAMDALRYFAVSYRKQEEYKPTYEQQQKEKAWRIGA